MVRDEMEMVSRLGDVDPLPAEALDGAEVLLRAAMASAQGDGERSSLRAAGGRRSGARWMRPRRQLIATAAAAAVVIGGGSAYLAAAGSTSNSPHQANAQVPPAKTIHAEVMAYVGSSPTLAVTSLPGYTLASSTDIQGPTPGLTGGSALLGKTFVSPQGDAVSVAEMVDSTGTPKMISLAAQYPLAAQQVTVGGHAAVLFDMSKVPSPDPSAPNAHIVGYVLYWSVSPTSWVMVSGGSVPAMEQVGSAVVPAN